MLGDRPNQVDRQRDDVEVTASDLLDVHIGRPVTAAGVHANVSVAIRYIEAWLRGLGAVGDRQPDGGCRDRRDLALAGVAVDPPGPLDRRGRPDHPRVHRGSHQLGCSSEVDRREGDRYDDAAEIFREVALGQEFPAFLTLPAYARFLVETD